MPLRRRAATVLAAASALTALTAPAALAAAPPAGLYGSGDPTYDGVWRQSYALLALHTEGVTPAASAVTWLAGQQCADGGFASYRADTAKACDPKTEDTNATGIALQALAYLGGHAPAVSRGVAWLKSVQNPDGGWSYNPGGASDPDSTGVIAGTLQITDKAGAKGASVRGRTPYDALRGFQFGCASKAADRGAFGYPTSGRLAVNAKATTDAVRGERSATFVVTPPEHDVAPKSPECPGGKDVYPLPDPEPRASAGAAWLVRQLTAGGDHLTAVTPGAKKPTPDYGTTADAVVALAACGELTTAKAAYTWLAANSAAWAHGNPAALAQLVLAAHATGQDPRHAGGADLVQQLANLGPAPAAATTRTTPASSASPKDHHKNSGSGLATWVIVAVAFVASIGVGILLSARKRRHL